MRDILIVVCVCVIKKFKLLRDSFFEGKNSEEKNQLFFCSFFFFLQEKSSPQFIHNSHFSLSLSLCYIYKNIKRQKERVIK